MKKMKNVEGTIKSFDVGDIVPFSKEFGIITKRYFGVKKKNTNIQLPICEIKILNGLHEKIILFKKDLIKLLEYKKAILK